MTGPRVTSFTSRHSVANSPLVSQITMKSNATTRMTISKSYDYLNRPTQISSASSAVSFRYSYNSANQRIHASSSNGSF